MTPKNAKALCERISLDVPQGKRAVYREAANQFKMSFAGLFQIAVEEFIANHSGEDVKDKLVQSERLTPRDKLLLEKFKQLQPKTQRAVMKFIDNMAGISAGQQKEEDTDGESNDQTD